MWEQGKRHGFNWGFKFLEIGVGINETEKEHKEKKENKMMDLISEKRI